MAKPDVVFTDLVTRELLQQSVDCVDHAILDRSEMSRIVERSRSTIARSRRLIAVMNWRYRHE